MEAKCLTDESMQVMRLSLALHTLLLLLLVRLINRQDVVFDLLLLSTLHTLLLLLARLINDQDVVFDLLLLSTQHTFIIHGVMNVCEAKKL